jgi:acyl-CoA thioester hydrolase
MQYLYHGNYAAYYHASRTELLRQIGLNDAALEEMGIVLPVTKLSSSFFKPAKYDDDLTVHTALISFSPCKMEFEHKVLREEELLNEGFTEVIFANHQTRRPIRIADELRSKLESIIKLKEK